MWVEAMTGNVDSNFSQGSKLGVYEKGDKERHETSWSITAFKSIETKPNP